MKRDLPLFDEDRGRTIRRAMEDQGVSAAAFEGDAERPLAARLADAVGEGAFAGGRVAGQASVRMAGDHARGQDQQVGRVERVDASGVSRKR
jgi:hypothetical protein